VTLVLPHITHSYRPSIEDTGDGTWRL
jgi:hypothetical protein